MPQPPKSVKVGMHSIILDLTRPSHARVFLDNTQVDGIALEGVETEDGSIAPFDEIDDTEIVDIALQIYKDHIVTREMKQANARGLDS